MLERSNALPPRQAAAIALAVVLIFGALGFTTWWQSFELKGYDQLTVATAPGKSSLPITIVGIDEESFTQVNKQWPWPRSLHAKLVSQLVKSGATVIAFDVLLSEASTAAEDQALADAIWGADNVVLAAHMAYQETALTRQWTRVNPLPTLLSAGATNGLADVDFDHDTIVRRIPTGADVFWREILKRFDTKVPGVIKVTEPARGTLIRYAGPDHTFPYVSYYQALEADTMLPPDAFRDQIVLVGRNIKASADAGMAQQDLFSTPFFASTRFLMPGVEIHANILESVVRGNSVVLAPEWWGQALLVLAVTVAALLMRRWRPILSGLAALAIVCALGALDWLLFLRMNTWLPVAAPALGALTIYLAYGGVAFLGEQRRRTEIRRAFSLYVSSEVVDHVMANPGRLKLGGERRDVTMFFTDLAGFTNITEAIGAEQVTQILNRHFTRATAIIKRHNGTVNRFIGDAIMAMWGAPLEDPRQAEHAIRAAIEVQKDIEELRTELRAQGLPEIRMRIGIHSCNAIIGNLGSDDRFDYTAIGDGVNLAARLEGVNKLYHTGILTTGETAAKVEGAIPMRLVDRVIVKGKSEPVDIYTPCTDAWVNEFTGQAVAAYRAQEWGQAEALFRELLQRNPDDGVASVYVERIRHLRVMAPAADWGGAVELEKL